MSSKMIRVIKEIEDDDDELSDTVPIELMQAEGIDVDLDTVYEVDVGNLDDSVVSSYGRSRFSSINPFKAKKYKGRRKRLPSVNGTYSKNNRNRARSTTGSFNEVDSVNSFTSEVKNTKFERFLNNFGRFYNSFNTNDNKKSVNNPRFKAKQLSYVERSYFSHWKGYFFYGLNESGALIPWIIIILFIPSWLKFSLLGLSSVFNFLGWFYIFMGLPELIGFIFAQALRRLGPLNMYPFEVGAIQITPYIHAWKLRVRVVVHDGKFGNPPNFPFPYFLECGRLDFEGAISLQDIGRTMLLKKTKAPLSKVPDFEYFMKIDFEHVEVTDAQVNFQMYDGRFNINEFTRILAEGEANHILKRDPFPNQLHVSIFRAKNLKPHRLKRTIDPYCIVRIRRNSKQTATQTETLNPMFNEKLIFNLDDPSVVMEIAVYDRDSPDGTQAAFIGHWAMTTKYLVCDPKYNFHIPEGYKTYKHKNLMKMPFSNNETKRNNEKETDEEEEEKEEEENNNSASYKELGFKGWIPLAAKNWEQMGELGQLEVKVVWKHVSKAQLARDDFEEKRKFTALEQLTQQSAEDQLRFGAWSRLKHWLDHEPFCYDIKRFTIRRTKFFLQDLFRGHKGNAESMLKSYRRNRKLKKQGPKTEEQKLDDLLAESNIQVAKETSGHVPIAFMEMTERFRPKKGDVGVTTYHVFLNFFVGLVFEFARKGKTGRAIAEIMSGGIFNLKSSIANVVNGEAKIGIKEGMEKLLKQTSAGFQVMHQKVTVNRLNALQFKFPVDAFDTDFLIGSDKTQISGYLDRATTKIKGTVTTERMIKLAKNWKLKFKTKYFEVKGQTIFYRRHESFQQGKVYNLTFKLSLNDVQNAVYLANQKCLILNVELHGHCVILRLPKKSPGRLESLQKWLDVLADHEIACTEEA